MTVRGLKKRAALLLINHVLAGTKWFSAKRQLLRLAGWEIGVGTKVVGPVFCTGTLIVGENCWLGRNLTIHGNGAVRIGDRCDLGPDVTFLTGGHGMGSGQRRAGAGETYTIRLEDGCWVGARATLMGNISMGRGSVLAACGCAVGDIPPDTLAGGVPAREIRKLYEA